MKYIKKYEGKNYKISPRSSIIRAIENDDDTLIDKLIDIDDTFVYNNTAGWTALLIATYNNKIEIVKKLISAGANLDIQNNAGSTALMCAANNNYILILEELIKAGADWNIQTRYGTDFITILLSQSVQRKQEIINMFPEEYEKYLTKKEIIKYNL